MIENDNTVTITREDYNELLDSRALLNCLVAAGVDNWEGYGFAMEMYDEITETE